MSWKIQGSYFENCNCDSVCPCTTSGLGHAADNDRCLPTFAIHIDTGNIDGVDVSGVDSIMVFDCPKNMAEGGWQVGMIIDSSASDDQANAVAGVLGGQAGGPMAALAPLVGEMLGVERAPVEYASGGGRHSVKSGNAVDIEINDTQQAEGGAFAGLTGIDFHPMGPELSIATASRARVKAFGKEWDNSGKNGHAAPFSWSA